MYKQEQKANYKAVRKEIKDLLYNPYDLKFMNYTRLNFDTLILIALDLIFDKLERNETGE